MFIIINIVSPSEYSKNLRLFKVATYIEIVYSVTNPSPVLQGRLGVMHLNNVYDIFY